MAMVSNSYLPKFSPLVVMAALRNIRLNSSGVSVTIMAGNNATLSLAQSPKSDLTFVLPNTCSRSDSTSAGVRIANAAMSATNADRRLTTNVPT